MKSIYLITYDISDDKKRFTIQKTCKSYGAFMLQRSVYMIRCAESHVNFLSKAIDKQMQKSFDISDSVYIFVLPDASHKDIMQLGARVDLEAVSGKDKWIIL